MSLTLKNIGAMQTADQQKNTKAPQATFGEVGTVTVTYQGVNYVFGPNQSITFADNEIGKAVDALSTSLRITDDRDGAAGSRW